MSNLRILISGAGVAGPALAFWLVRAGARVTIVERATQLRAIGQNVDIRGAALDVLRRMGLEDVIRENCTNEEGMAIVDGSNRTRALFGVDQGKGLTAEVEIIRGQLAVLLYDSTKEKVEYIFGDYITSVDETDDRIRVTFAKDTKTRDFDILIAADGLYSSTRSLLFPKTCIRPLNQYIAWFSIPYEKHDGVVARWYNAPGRRCITMRPSNVGTTMVVLMIMSTADRFHNHHKLAQPEQKKFWRQLFEDAGWEASRVLDGMDQADDFYIQANAQVKLDSWSKGRIGMVGDAAYCPSPISGMGTSVGLVGAYVLAGEISKCGRDYSKAFREYEEKTRPFVTKAQKLVPGLPGMAYPETAWGIKVMYAILAFLSWSGLMNLLIGIPEQAIVLPEYGL